MGAPDGRGAARVVCYAPGGAGKIRVDGRALADGETLNPTRPIALEIEGIGTITIAPGQSEGAEDDAADLAAQQRSSSRALLRKHAAPPRWRKPSGALAERRALRGAAGRGDRAAQGAAPEGSSGLKRVHAELAAARRICWAPAPTRTPERAGLARAGAR